MNIVCHCLHFCVGIWGLGKWRTSHGKVDARGTAADPFNTIGYIHINFSIRICLGPTSDAKQVTLTLTYQ